MLEVAAGTGLITKSIAPRVRHVVAMDYANAMVAVLRRRVAEANLSNVECVSGDIYALAYPPASFDVVVAGNVLHLVPDLSGALGELIRVLRPGGKLIAPTFCHDETRLSWLVSRALSVLGQPMHRRFTTASLRRALEEVGLRIRRSETIPGLIPIAHIERPPGLSLLKRSSTHAPSRCAVRSRSGRFSEARRVRACRKFTSYIYTR